MARNVLVVESFGAFSDIYDLLEKYTGDSNAADDVSIGTNYGCTGKGVRFAGSAGFGNFMISFDPGTGSSAGGTVPLPVVLSFAARIVTPPEYGSHGFVTFYSSNGPEYAIAIGAASLRSLRPFSYASPTGQDYTSWLGPFPSANTWHRYEIKIFASPTDGFCNVYIDDQLVMIPNGGGTSPHADTHQKIIGVRFGWSTPGGGANSTVFDISDVVIAASDDLDWLDDPAVPSNTTDRIESAWACLPLDPSADSTVEWTPLGAGTNTAEVDEAVHDADTSYNESSTASEADALTLEAIPSPYSGGTLLAAQLNVVAKQTNAGTRTIAPQMGGREGDTVLCSTDYTYHTFVIDDDGGSPAGALAEADLTPIGYELKS